MISVGSELGPWRVEYIDPEKMRVFADALGDPNPIHFDPEATKAAGLGDRVISQGPASTGYVLNMLREALPQANIADLVVRFNSNVYGGDSVTAGGRVDSVEDVEGVLRITCSVWVDVDDDGRRAMAGVAVLTADASQ